jgi:flagellar M-ring protein FliF
VADTGLDQMTQQMRAMVGSLGQRRIVGFTLVFLAIVAGVGGVAYWVTQPTWALLATDVEPDSMNSVVARLKALKVDYQLDPGGRAIRVDAMRVDELRMQMAAEGLPDSGRIGFELFDQTTFGATEMTEQVNFQRALEGELTRTIRSLGAVSNARVHLVLPRSSLFATESEPAKAGITLRLKPGRSLAAAEVDGIVALVASSVEGLGPEGVTVLDTSGRQLSRALDRAETGTDRVRFERQLQLERDMAARVVAMLEPVVGAGRVRANVSAHLKADSEDELEELWDPTSVVRSRQQTVENDGRAVASGAAGARANLPPANDPNAPPERAPAPPTVSNNNRQSEVTNYEVSKVTRHKVSPAGQLSRLSVAVLVDDIRKVVRADDGTETVEATPRTPEELQRLHALVASAVGLVPDRGDQLTVENIGFDLPDPGPALEYGPPVPTWQVMWEQAQRNWKVVAGVFGGLVALIALFFGIRSFRKRGAKKPVALPATVPGMAGPRLATAGGAPIAAANASAAAAAIAGGEDDDDSNPALPPSPSRQLARLAQTEPEQLARIVRGWLAEEER